MVYVLAIVVVVLFLAYKGKANETPPQIQLLHLRAQKLEPLLLCAAKYAEPDVIKVALGELAAFAGHLETVAKDYNDPRLPQTDALKRNRDCVLDYQRITFEGFQKLKLLAAYEQLGR